MSCLRLFDGHSVPLTEQAVPFVGRALRLSNTLVTLHLEAASLSGRPMLLIGKFFLIYNREILFWLVDASHSLQGYGRQRNLLAVVLHS